MTNKRISKHPVLEVPNLRDVPFFWENKKYFAKEHEVISSALIANGIDVFSYHYREHSHQGIFCANGQCSQCTVIADGVPVKSCMVEVQPDMKISLCKDLPELPKVNEAPKYENIEEVETEVLIIGGGPSGLNAAIELGNYGVNVLIIDDKHKLGGKLVLQTHKFFGSEEDCYAGTRGNDIGTLLQNKVNEYPSIKVWLNSTVLYVFSDKKVGIIKNGKYTLVKPKIILVAAGARERALQFTGCTLPGVYGAGAFQTLVNRDLIKPCENLFIIGGGNVGLIAAYHALQAGINVVGLIEALPECSGYKVHKDKIVRLGVPVYLAHTVIAVHGKDKVESITIAQIDENWKPIKETYKTFKVDTVLVAVGLNPVNEFYNQAKEAGIEVYSCGDSEEIAEASSAMFSGKIAGIKIARSLGKNNDDIPESWNKKAEILKSRPGEINKVIYNNSNTGVFPVINCVQEIPCNPCTTACPQEAIQITDNSLMGLPQYTGKCTGCLKCVSMCPALAITVVDYRKNPEKPIVTIPYEISQDNIQEGMTLTVNDMDGNELGQANVVKIRRLKGFEKTLLIQVEADKSYANKVAGLKLPGYIVEGKIETPAEDFKIDNSIVTDESITCRCERITAGDIRKLIRSGVRDLNQIKAITYAGMGPCGSKVCESLILHIMKMEGISLEEITLGTKRPVFVEVPFGVFVGQETNYGRRGEDNE